ncbi:THAP domain-containing protein 2-like [Centruroides vittatus]|uniref:THAP domain-containing protein 2-like n=1 Tax=Centruroides vittatus TaxID=120091 RepID=UPI00350F15A0
MPNCCVAVCENYNQKTKGSNVIYHSFPKHPTLRSKWIHACKREDKVNVENATVCSAHFLKDDYERNLKAEILNIPSRRRLKPDAVPSLNLAPVRSSDVPCTSEIVEQMHDRTIRYTQRENRKRALNRLSHLSPKKNKIDIGTETEPISEPSLEVKLAKKLDLANAKIDHLKREIFTLKRKNKLLHLALTEKNQKLKLLESKKHEEVNEKINNILKKIFTKTQIDCLITQKNEATLDKRRYSKSTDPAFFV